MENSRAFVTALIDLGMFRNREWLRNSQILNLHNDNDSQLQQEMQAPAGEPKAKKPLDSLPKSTFNLENWKRAYSNKDTRGADGAIEWFYQK